MCADLGKISFEIAKYVLHDPQYHDLSSVYYEKFENLQEISQSFTTDQWKALNEYIAACLKVHNKMMELALMENLSPEDHASGM